LVERAASLCGDGIEIVDGVEVEVGERLIDERSEVFDGARVPAMGAASRRACCRREWISSLSI
jgi:hypothetical protein